MPHSPKLRMGAACFASFSQLDTGNHASLIPILVMSSSPAPPALLFQGRAVRFPFGHGLSYTIFEYAWEQPPLLTGRADGPRDGSSFSSGAAEPTARGAVAGGTPPTPPPPGPELKTSSDRQGGSQAPREGAPLSAAGPVVASFSVTITNTGPVAGAEVAQFYLRFPVRARHAKINVPTPRAPALPGSPNLPRTAVTVLHTVLSLHRAARLPC